MKLKIIEKQNFSKMLRIVKLTSILLFLFLFQVQANAYSQSSFFNINMKGTALKKILKEVEKQSEYTFLYNDAKIDVNIKKSINVKNEKLEIVLDKVFENTGISYEIIDKQIVLRKRTTQNKVTQKKTVTGKVTDIDGLPIPGVTVSIKGTTSGTLTDATGNFTIDVTSRQVLVFSFLGYKTVEVAYTNQTNLNIVLEIDDFLLDEAIVVGYGVQKKSVVTGAISSIKGDELIKMPVAKVEQALQGKVSGVVITQNTGQPGSEMSVRIRGTGSTGFAEPLYIVDGVQTGDLSSLNPADIESIEILKDAASGAIYGARAANGVVLVTTKKGKAGKMSVSYSSSYQHKHFA